MSAPVSARSEILPLTGLRFIAALYVFLFHIHINWPLTAQPFLKNILDQGAIGMSLFFILSGFVLCYQYSDRPTVSYTEYLINRFARIYPIYLLAAVVTLPWFGIPSEAGATVGTLTAIAQGAMLVLVNIFMIQAWFPQLFVLWNIGGSWSISVEAFCYVLLPVALPFMARLSRSNLRIVIAICIILAAIPGLFVKLFETSAPFSFYSMPIYRLPEFLSGVGICLLLYKYGVRRVGTVGQLLIIVLFASYLGKWGPLLPIYVGHNWITLPVMTFMILMLVTGKGIFSALLSNRAFIWLGRISYCFYSLQALMLRLIMTYHEPLVSAFPALSNNRYLGAVAFVILVALSAAAYYLIEEPCRIKIRQMYRARQTRQTSLVPA